MESNGDRFIDAEEQYGGDETSNYENTLNKQLQRCADVLSKEWVGGYIKKSKNSEEYVEDIRISLIKSVDTFRILLSPFIKKEADKKKIKDILESIENYKTIQGERFLQVQGSLPKKIKDMQVLPSDSLPMKELIEFKANKYKDMFELLVQIYFTTKSEIAALSYE